MKDHIMTLKAFVFKVSTGSPEIDGLALMLVCMCVCVCCVCVCVCVCVCNIFFSFTRWVHLECERQGKEADWDPRSQGSFLCSVCRQGEGEAEAEGSQTQESTPTHP